MEIGNKDLYEYILNLADDKTTINMIRANPKVFDNERFYEKVMRKRYPLLIEFRKKKETWKALYLRMVYTLAKLQESYQIPYIPTEGCNPEIILLGATTGDVYNRSLECAVAGGNIPLIDYFLEKGATNINQTLLQAGKRSNLNTVKYLISKGANNYQNLFQGAAGGGNIDIMQFALDALIAQGFDINDHYAKSALDLAIFYGQAESVKFLIDRGITIRPYNIEYAESQAQYAIAEYMKQFL